jgi:hypothetical protein
VIAGAFLMRYIQYSWVRITHGTCVLRLSGKGIRLLGLDKKMGELELTIIVFTDNAPVCGNVAKVGSSIRQDCFRVAD